MIDIYNKELPNCIPQDVHDKVVTEIEKGNLYEPYNHWISAGAYLVVLKSRIDALQAEIKNYTKSNRIIKRFLWKPVSEGGAPQYQGNPVVLVDLENVQVVVNGDYLKDHGPSNGRGTTARSLKKCSQVLSPAEVTFYEKDGKRISTKKGDKEIIESPCSRKEWNY